MTTTNRIAITLTALLLPNVLIAADPTADRMPAFDLLRYRDAAGVIRTAKTAEDWNRRRDTVLQGMQAVMGKLPDRKGLAPPTTRVLETVDAGSYLRQLVEYESGSNAWTPAYLCIPKGISSSKLKAPAVLCLHPTDNKVGHKVVLGLGGRPGRQYAAELSELGYVTISPAYPHLANYWPNLGKLGYVSGTMKAIFDNMRAIDLLESLPFVDTSKGVGAIGHSLGGHNAIYTAVFDQRISVIATSCGFDSYQDYRSTAANVWNFGQGWCQIRYMPRLSNYRGRLTEIPFDFPELIGSLAPRPIYINAPLHDSNFQWRSVDRCVDAARPVYELLGKASDMVVEHPDCPHNFPEAQRQAAYRVIDSVLRSRTQR